MIGHSDNISAHDKQTHSQYEESHQSQIQAEHVRQQLFEIEMDSAIKQVDHRDFLVNTGFSFQITDYFKFQNQQQIQQQQTFFRDINQYSYIAWVILLYSVISSSMIPPWLMTIKADKLLRVSWKCLLHLIMLIPFVLYERRTANQRIKDQYKISYILTLKNIKKVWILAFTGSFWPTAILTSIQWTYISHCMVLGSLTNLFLSFQRIIYSRSSKMEIGGTLTAIFGILFVIYDSYQLNVDEATSFEWNVFNYFYLTRKRYQRVLGDLAALTIGFCMYRLSKLTSDIKQYYPPYLLLFLNNLFTSIFMVFSAFFFNGATFDFNSQWGVFALLSQKHFTNFLYMSIVLSMGTFISFVMVSKIFPDPVVPAIAMTLQPILATVLFHFAGVQTIPGPYGCFGYMLIVPGMIIILTGNCFKTRTKSKNDKEIPLLQIKKSPQKLAQQEKKEQNIRFSEFAKQY